MITLRFTIGSRSFEIGLRDWLPFAQWITPAGGWNIQGMRGNRWSSTPAYTGDILDRFSN